MKLNLIPSVVSFANLASASVLPVHVLPRAPAGAPIASTCNGSYYGTHNSVLNQDYFLGVPFAQPPIKDLRFANPASLNISWNGALPATNYAFTCIGYGGDQIGYQQSEDCLYLNIVRPSGYENQTLPVAAWIHGGGFYMGSAVDRRYNLSFIVDNSVKIGKPVMAVSIAYRLGPFGFLNGNDVVKSGATNVGLKDQRHALQWINQNIAGFGGDPTKVTIWGESAGAASVGFQLTAFNGRDDKLFRAAIMESGNPVFYAAANGSEFYQPRYAALVAAAGCKDCSDTLKCLRDLPLFVLNNILNTTTFNTMWNPTIDGDIVARLGSEQLADGSYVKVPIISGANADEGTAFSPVGIDSPDNIAYYLNTNTSEQPALPALLAQEILSTYLSDDPSYLIPSSDTLGGNVTLGAPYGSYYRRSAAYFGDLYFIAARRLTCQTWAMAGLPAYCYRFNVAVTGVPWPIQATHFQEVAFVFNNLNGLGYSTNPFLNKSESYTALSGLMSKSWASFVHDMDPNSFSGSSGWPAYDTNNPMNIVWDANVTSYAEADTYRAAGIKLLNDHWGLFNR